MTYVIEKFQFCLYNRAMQAPTHNFSHPRWTWMTSLGWIVGLIVAILAGDLVGDSDFVFTYFGGITALFVGLMQWLVIRKFAITPQWIWLTVLGVGAGFFLVEGILWILAQALDIHFKQDEAFFFVPLESALGGLACGWLQSKYQLSRVSSATGWTFTQCLGWFAPTAVIMMWAFATTGLFKGRNPILAFSAFLFIFGPGALLGWLTGKKLKTMLSEHHWVTLPPL